MLYLYLWGGINLQPKQDLVQRISYINSVDGTLHVSLEEKPLTKEEIGDRQVFSKGFMPVSTMKDFPIRGQAAVLLIKRRRWTDMKNSKIFTRDFNYRAVGTRMTSEFALFLNKAGRS